METVDIITWIKMDKQVKQEAKSKDKQLKCVG